MLVVAEKRGEREKRILYNSTDAAITVDNITVSEFTKRSEKMAFCKEGLTGNVIFE